MKTGLFMFSHDVLLNCARRKLIDPSSKYSSLGSTYRNALYSRMPLYLNSKRKVMFNKIMNTIQIEVPKIQINTTQIIMKLKLFVLIGTNLFESSHILTSI